MSNHSFVTTKKWLKTDKVEGDLLSILQKRFGGKIPYTREGDYFEIGFDYPYNLSMWVENVHKLEFRNPRPDWCWWVQSVLHNEFALLYNGTISDEGVSEKWKGEENKFPTFSDYMDMRLQEVRTEEYLKFLRSLIDKAPDKVKETYNGR